MFVNNKSALYRFRICNEIHTSTISRWPVEFEEKVPEVPQKCATRIFTKP